MANEKKTTIIPQKFQWLWIIILGGILAVGLLFVYIANFMLPDTVELENPKYEIASKLLANDGTELGKAFKLNREWLTFEQINPHLVKALVATEDERFYQHSGIDMWGTTRAVVFLGTRGGASTIPQQLAKLFFTNRSTSFVKRTWQKLKEWVIAVEFEKRYTKEELIAMYLNKYDFLYGGIGVSTAAKTYFGKDQKQLTVDEAAILIGMLKNPRLFNPKINPERGFTRRSVVLKQMVKNDMLDEATYQQLIKRKINMENFTTEEYSTGLAPYFRVETIKWVKNLLEDDRYRKPDGTKYNIYTDGLTINTSIDITIQKHAEAALKEHMVALQKKYFTVWEGRDPWTIGATAEQKVQRQNKLGELMRQTDRFRKLRVKHLSDIVQQIYQKVENARLDDNDIFRLFEADKDRNYLSKLVDQNIITSEQKSVYLEILSLGEWKKLQDKWRLLKKDADFVFNKKIPLKVYDYVTGNEKTVTMSPLDSIKYMQSHMQLGSVVVDAKTGEIKAWIGGINHKHFQFDHVRSNRQVGSTVKPFIYGTAIIDQAMSPCLKVQDVQECIPANDENFHLASTWCPSNSDGKFTGQWLTLKEALKQSKNNVSVHLMKLIGNVERVKDFMASLKIDRNKVSNYPAICLGTPELSVLDMATAYTAFANNGTQSNPIFVTSIVDRNGKIIYSAVPEQKRAINPSYNYVIVDMLKYVAAVIQPKFKSEIAGKTGTTNDFKDGWFVGFTPNVVISTWVGGDAEWIRFNNITNGQGAVMARPFFEKVLAKMENDPTVKYDKMAKFQVPEEQLVELDCSLYENMAKQQTAETPAPNKAETFEDEFE